MPARRQPPQPSWEVRKYRPDEAARCIAQLQTRISEVEALKASVDDAQRRAIEQKIRGTLLEVFGEHSLEFSANQSHGIYFNPGGMSFVRGGPPSPSETRGYVMAGIPRTITMLENLMDTVKERTETTPTRPVVDAIPAVAKGMVFVVHGRAEAPRDAVARFLAQLGLTPVILQEQASEGKTIIEKFEKHADVGYAVVLLTGDDHGGLAGDDPANYQPRARQNVILELGYFVGKLGRAHVCVLHEQGVEIPSDFHGVVYLVLDGGEAWKLTLAREMKVAGLNVDMNRAL